ncbi:MAG: hypothetical protein A4E45_02306 [Methanosaeta sp. PtaB.Bin039]|nr:MAG: hypothetical protein A4E45_02306 [Methanosaeta sp. PtaB.Bin039]
MGIGLILLYLNNKCNTIFSPARADNANAEGRFIGTLSAAICIGVLFLISIGYAEEQTEADEQLDQIIYAGVPQNYTYIVTNRGDVNLTNVVVYDDLVDPVVYDSGDDNGDGWLNLSEVWVFKGTQPAVGANDSANHVEVSATDPCGELVGLASDIEVIKILSPSDEPIQYQQYCHSQKVAGEGDVDIATRMIDRKIALRYNNQLLGSGDFEIEGENALSENASKLIRNVGDDKVPLNLFESSKISYAGDVPLVGSRKLESQTVFGGIGAKIQETFATAEIEKNQSVFFSATDAVGHWTDPIAREEWAASNGFESFAALQEASPSHLLGIDTKNEFRGTWGMDSRWHVTLQKDIKSHQRFTGAFEVQKLTKIHEAPFHENETVGCSFEGPIVGEVRQCAGTEC